MKYLVMECHMSYAVVLDEQGRFLKAANCNYEVGQTVTDIVELRIPEQRKTIHWAKPLSAIAACLVLVLSLFLFQGPYASVYLTINPEVRIDVNRNDVVMKVAGVNADGETLISGYDYRRKDLDTVMDELVNRAIDLGFLHEGGTVKLTLDGEAEWVERHETHLQEQLNTQISDRITVTIDIDCHRDSHHATTPTGPIHIPLEDTDYGDTDYGPPEDHQSDYAEHTDGETPYDDTDYGPNNDGVTDYDDTDYGPNADGVTDYDDTDYGPNADGVTDYDDTDYGSGSDGVTDYEHDSPYDDHEEGHSDYDGDD